MVFPGGAGRPRATFREKCCTMLHGNAACTRAPPQNTMKPHSTARGRLIGLGPPTAPSTRTPLPLTAAGRTGGDAGDALDGGAGVAQGPAAGFDLGEDVGEGAVEQGRLLPVQGVAGVGPDPELGRAAGGETGG